MPFARLLKHLRESQRISMAALARRSGLAKSTVSMLESGQRRPGLESLRKLETGLGLTGDDRARFREAALTAGPTSTDRTTQRGPAPEGFLACLLDALFAEVSIEDEAAWSTLLKGGSPSPFTGVNAAPFSVHAGKKYGATDGMRDRIASEDLRPGDLPDPEDDAAVFAFVHTFDGYAHFGSLEAAAEHAGKQPRATLDDLRNELFVAARASRFVEGADEMVVDLYREIQPLILAKIGNGPDS